MRALRDAVRRAGELGLLGAAGASDTNQALLRELLALGATVVSAEVLGPGQGPLSPCMLVRLADPRDPSRDQLLPVGLDAALADMVRDDAGAPERDGAHLAAELRRVVASLPEASPEERSSVLMDWIMERLDASRCALVPFEAGTPGEPLAFHLRGGAHHARDARRLPSRVLEFVARTRQPLVAHDVRDPLDPLGATGSIGLLGIRSYMAVPVVFRGDLLAIMFVDRFDRPRPFTPAEQTAFEAIAHELARPLLGIREQQSRRDYELLLRGILEGDDARPAEVLAPVTRALLERARALAPLVDEHLLLLGETGVGKEWLALRIHEMSGRRGPFLPVNVASIPSDLFESEMAGAARGAFTGAVDRTGFVVQAERGTLFLDEIGDLEPANQVKLLRLLQDRRVRPLGGAAARAVDVRIVAATNRPLQAMVAKGVFREDLLHRFAPPLEVPPLRQRREEIEPLARAWLARKARERGVPVPELTPEALRLLREHAWPGNVRQLQVVVAHALLAARSGRITPGVVERLLIRDAHPAEGPPPPETWKEMQEGLAAIEADWLKRALAREHGNVDAAARRIGCPATTFRRALLRHGLSEPRDGDR